MRSKRVMECRGAGVLECGSSGVLECRGAGVLVCGSSGVLECRGAGVLGCWSSGVLRRAKESLSSLPNFMAISQFERRQGLIERAGTLETCLVIAVP